MSLSDIVVIVTGSSSGIGASTAIQFAKKGANVTNSGRDQEKLKQVANKISQIGKPALVVKADISVDEEAKQIIQKTVEKFGKIDVLINNAGFATFVNTSDENFVKSYNSVINTNLRSVVVLTNAAIPYLKKTKGNIVNISSIAGNNVVSAGLAHYCTSKAGLDQFTRNCATELAEFGIRVNIVSPGPVETYPDNPDYKDVAEKITALKIYTQPEEVADLILYLASDKARSVTGSDYMIDAGSLVKGQV